MRRRSHHAATLCAPIACAALCSAAAAGDLNAIQTLTQSEFRRLSEDIGAAVSYKALIPAEPLGVTGFDLGVGINGTRLKHRALWERAAGGDDVPGTLPVAALRLHKGLPFDIDVGAVISGVPDSNVRYYGGELRWAVLPGDAVTPAVAVRAALTRINGVDQLKLKTESLDVSVSKGFALLTPYAGIGQVWVSSTPQGVPLLGRESFTQSKVFAGLNVNFVGTNVVFEVDVTGGTTTYGAKLGFRF